MPAEKKRNARVREAVVARDTKEETETPLCRFIPLQKPGAALDRLILVMTVRSIPSGCTSPSFRARVISMSAQVSVSGRRLDKIGSLLFGMLGQITCWEMFPAARR